MVGRLFGRLESGEIVVEISPLIRACMGLPVLTRFSTSFFFCFRKKKSGKTGGKGVCIKREV